MLSVLTPQQTKVATEAMDLPLQLQDPLLLAQAVEVEVALRLRHLVQVAQAAAVMVQMELPQLWLVLPTRAAAGAAAA
jgi:hypothetical protein